MDKIVIFWNTIFVVFSSIIAYYPLKRIVTYRTKSVADYAISLIYLFNCIPVLFDIVLGIPKYRVWYSAFQEVIALESVCLIYNAYILIVLTILSLYARYSTKKLAQIGECNNINQILKRKPAVDIILMLLPISYAFYKTGISAFIGYTTLLSRGVNARTVTVINQLMLISIYIAITWFFASNQNKGKLFLLFAYFFLLIWINGKRYIIVTILEAFLFVYQISRGKEITKEKKGSRINLRIWLPIILIIILAFSGYYILNVKITANTGELLYSNLRIDFGRDDVTKFAINEVLLKKQSILDYPGQTFLSSFLMFVPRVIWPSKPYPHYNYLTAAIFQTSISNIPSGMTPSVFEMSICNFGWAGIIVCILLLVMLCVWTDKQKDLGLKLILLLIITNILSQSLDAAASLILLFVFCIFTRTFTIGGTSLRSFYCIGEKTERFNL